MFIVIGYFAFVAFDQGQDILRTLGFGNDGEVFRQTIFAFIAVSWWSWQTFRASRVLLHFSYFNFWNYQPAYSLRAQVMVPRILAIIPYLIVAYGIYKAGGEWNAVIILLLSGGLWMYVFLQYRKELIVWIRANKPVFHGFVPDYIPIKNGSYPASFIWQKQKIWLGFRLAVVLAFFVLTLLFPVTLPRFLGSSAVVLFAFGSWLIIAAQLIFIEKFLKFPVSFSVLVMLILFSFFNNNHDIKSKDSLIRRPTVSNHFQDWIAPRLLNMQKTGEMGDSLDVYLVMAEGGGIRSAYWTNGVLDRLFTEMPELKKNLYAYSAVSGGALGVTLTASLSESANTDAAAFLEKDFLAPVTAALTFNDMLQRFIPFPIRKFDRMRVLERSWEEAWLEIKPENSGILWSDGFVETFSKPGYPLLLLNSTHVESGRRTIVSNANLSELESNQIKDVFDVTNKDIPISTAVGLSSRFPFLTPPALIKNEDGKTWGSLVDGGYYENLGVRTMVDVYTLLKEVSATKYYPVRFHFLAIRNTKASTRETPVKGMFEIISPMITFSNIWANNGNEALRDAQHLTRTDGQSLHEIHLIREDEENIPLGWFLSNSARANIERQLYTIRTLEGRKVEINY